MSEDRKENPLGTGSSGRPSRSSDESDSSERTDKLKESMQDLVRINADVPRPLRKWLQIQAAKEERAMRRIVIDALKLYKKDSIE